MPDATASSKPLEAGNLVLLDYEIWAEGIEKEELVDTTRAEAAQKANLSAPEGVAWEPRPHLVGGEYFPPAIEQALVGATVGVPISRKFPPAEAFGAKDPKLIELFSMHEISRLPEMRKEDAELNIGTMLTIRGRRGRVVSMTAARVRVDFNPAFAGRTIRAEMVPVRRIEEPADQVRAIVEMSYGHGKEFEVRLHQGVVTLRVPDRSKFDLNWVVVKPRVIERIRTQLSPKSIHLVEEYATPVAKAETPPAEAAAPSGSAPSEGSPTPPSTGTPP